jgi:hypothetical protein
MNRWLALLLLVATISTIVAACFAVIGWRARAFERRAGIGPDDGGRYTGGSDLDHLAIDQARDDAHL